VIAIIVLAIWIWRAAFLPILAIVLLVTFLMHLWNREGYVIEGVNPNVRKTGNRILGT